MNKGFTIIEFMIIIALISLLSAVLILGSQGEEQRLALQRSALKMVQDIREVQEMAMAAKQFDCQPGAAYSFGIYFHSVDYPESYLVFADCDLDHRKSSLDKIVKEISLEKQVKVYDLGLSSLDIVFLPPEPITYINGQEQANQAVITIALKSNPFRSINQKKIKVNSVGRIEIE